MIHFIIAYITEVLIDFLKTNTILRCTSLLQRASLSPKNNSYIKQKFNYKLLFLLLPEIFPFLAQNQNLIQSDTHNLRFPGFGNGYESSKDHIFTIAKPMLCGFFVLGCCCWVVVLLFFFLESPHNTHHVKCKSKFLM